MTFEVKHTYTHIWCWDHPILSNLLLFKHTKKALWQHNVFFCTLSFFISDWNYCKIYLISIPKFSWILNASSWAFNSLCKRKLFLYPIYIIYSKQHGAGKRILISNYLHEISIKSGKKSNNLNCKIFAKEKNCLQNVTFILFQRFTYRQ